MVAGMFKYVTSHLHDKADGLMETLNQADGDKNVVCNGNSVSSWFERRERAV